MENNKIIIPENLHKQVQIYATEKNNLIKKLKEIERFENIYRKELRVISNQFHTTKDGVVIHLSEMKEDHLLNTARMFYNKFGENRNSPTMKYIEEIKRRNLIDKYLVLTNQKKKLTEEEESEIDTEFNILEIDQFDF
ncbi:hypothetical protein EKK58_06045 [Candidatus Dependentiae bacterium]|nr:MAG: hypothetical protein EKK58_06045 [Candidatus Dependentiae bacterium]